MPDNWGFVAAAYLLTALVLGAYWQRLVRRERERRAHGSAPTDRTKISMSANPRPPLP